MTNKPDILISKSRYLSGLRCDKLLWSRYKDKDLFPPYSKAVEGRFRQGHEVGRYAQLLFPDGEEAAPGKYLAEDTVPPTQKLIERRIPIYEAGLVHGCAYVLVDILNPVGGDEWDLYEVKSTTSYRPEKHLADVAIQKYTAQGSGLKIRNCYLIHLNNQYVRTGEINPSELLVATDITEEVEAFVGQVEGDLEYMLRVIGHEGCPDTPLSAACWELGGCDLQPVCWAALPSHHVMTLYSGKARGLKLLEEGTEDLMDVGDDHRFTGKQNIQIKAVKSGDLHIDKAHVGRFLKQLEYPLAFLDFETLSSAVPLYEGTRPYQAVPFQFSLHVVTGHGEKPVHHSYLADGRDDPRAILLERLKTAMPPAGSVVAYNAPFEKGVLGSLAEFDPACASWVEELNRRMIDLLIPFRSFAVYHPQQRGSASMKAVLPALTEESYEDIDMGGEDAGYEFMRITFDDDVKMGEIKKIRNAMEDYCKQDTAGMVAIINRLEELVGFSKK
ncbi:DUF2779 domain-containing protein [bacterium]|nr:MAG: DUF2779 domain-containing protein [bacterium]